MYEYMTLIFKNQPIRKALKHCYLGMSLCTRAWFDWRIHSFQRYDVSTDERAAGNKSDGNSL
jgi:hypothetical protein